jgi:hydroxymethylpyrimidine/phosphomethylpyrimidine kinase
MLPDDVCVALTIAGSDSGGGAGIQADLRTFQSLDVFGTSAITCVTAQNPHSISHVQAVEPAVVVGQIEQVLSAFPVTAIKTGMLFNAAIVTAVSEFLKRLEGIAIVVDPVMVATSGARLLEDDAVSALRDRLLPLATVVTPNVPEAEWLTGKTLDAAGGQVALADKAAEQFGTACVLKGGHLAGGELSDVLSIDGTHHRFSFERVQTTATHGTGCTFAAAVTASLAKGHGLVEAVDVARDYVHRCLSTRRQAGPNQVMGWGPTLTN